MRVVTNADYHVQGRDGRVGVSWLALARVSGWLTARPSDEDTLSRVVETGAHTIETEERVASSLRPPPCPYRGNGGVYSL